MSKVEILSVSDDEIKMLKKGIFSEGTEHDLDYVMKSAEIFRKLSVEEAASLINDSNFIAARLFACWAFRDDKSCENKMIQAISLYKQREIEKFIEHYSDGSAIEYMADKNFSELIHLGDSIEELMPEEDEDSSCQFLDKTEAEKYLNLVNGLFPIDGDPMMRPDYSCLSSLATSLGYYSSVGKEDVCDYLVSGDESRSKLYGVILNGGEGFLDLAKSVSLRDKILMTVDFVVNYNEQNKKGFAKYDTSSFVNDFLSDQVINSTVLGIPVHMVITHFEPSLRDRFFVNHNTDYNLETFSEDMLGDTEMLEKLSNMFSQDIDSKRDTLTDSVTPSTK